MDASDTVSAARRHSPPRARPFVVRSLEERDLGQASEVEKDAFPTLFPPTSFRRELRSRIARYLVLARTDHADSADPSLPPLPNSGERARGGPLFGRLMNGARQVWRNRNPSWKPGDELIAGFVGLWYVADRGARGRHRGCAPSIAGWGWASCC